MNASLILDKSLELTALLRALSFCYCENKRNNVITHCKYAAQQERTQE